MLASRAGGGVRWRARRAPESSALAGERAGRRAGEARRGRAWAGSPEARRPAPRPGARPRGHPIRPRPAGLPGRGWRLAPAPGGNSGEVVHAGDRAPAAGPARPGSLVAGGGLFLTGCEGGVGGSTPLPGPR